MEFSRLPRFKRAHPKKRINQQRYAHIFEGVSIAPTFTINDRPGMETYGACRCGQTAVHMNNVVPTVSSAPSAGLNLSDESGPPGQSGSRLHARKGSPRQNNEERSTPGVYFASLLDGNPRFVDA